MTPFIEEQRAASRGVHFATRDVLLEDQIPVPLGETPRVKICPRARSCTPDNTVRRTLVLCFLAYLT